VIDWYDGNPLLQLLNAYGGVFLDELMQADFPDLSAQCQTGFGRVDRFFLGKLEMLGRFKLEASRLRYCYRSLLRTGTHQ
jgi:hypothetical protein